MIQIIIFSVIALGVIIFLKNYHPEYGVIVAAVAGALLLTAIIIELSAPIKQLLNMLEEYGVKSELTAYLLKALGICYITRFCSDLCNDFGQSSLSSKVEFAGKAAIFILSLPIIGGILDIGLALV